MLSSPDDPVTGDIKFIWPPLFTVIHCYTENVSVHALRFLCLIHTGLPMIWLKKIEITHLPGEIKKQACSFRFQICMFSI